MDVGIEANRKVPTGAAVALSLIVLGCGGGPGPGEVDPAGPPPLFVRHWDQVCSVAREPVFLSTEELLDTIGLGEELKSAGILSAPGTTEPPELGIVLWYERSGLLEAAGRWETTMDPEPAARAEQVLASRARPLDRLLDRSSFYVVLKAGPEPQARIERSRTCMPHMRHPEQGRPYGLPDSVSTWYGRRSFRNDTTSATVRLQIDQLGQVFEVDSLGGPGWAVEAARQLVGELSFDPALLNGRAVLGVLEQSFRFRAR